MQLDRSAPAFFKNNLNVEPLRLVSSTHGKIRSSHRMCSVQKCALRNFAKFTGKHLCHSLFFHKLSKSTFFTEHFTTTASDKWLFSYLIGIHTCFFCASNFTYALKLKLYREFSLIKELSVGITKKLLLSVKYTCVTWYVTVLTFISCQVISLL